MVCDYFLRGAEEDSNNNLKNMDFFSDRKKHMI